jgi:hypothetical protein
MGHRELLSDGSFEEKEAANDLAGTQDGCRERAVAFPTPIASGKTQLAFMRRLESKD